MRALSSLLLRSAAALAAGGLFAHAASAEIVGKATAVNVEALKEGRTLAVDAEVIRNERIQTDGAGSVQLLFVDRTTMNIGPNSDIVIDSFVYDPQSGHGTMAISMTKGMLRFVGGQVTHTGGATLRTPGATMGIRGGTGQFVVGGGSTQATFLGSNEPGGGITIVDESCGSTNLFRAGFTSESGGGQCGAPRRIDPSELSEQNAMLTSPPGADGGAGVSVASEVSTISQTEQGRVTRDRAEPRRSEKDDDKFGSDEAETAAKINQQVEATTFALNLTGTDYGLLGVKPKGEAPVVLGSKIVIQTSEGGEQESFFDVTTGVFLPSGNGNKLTFQGGTVGSASQADGEGGQDEDHVDLDLSSQPGGVTAGPGGVPTGGIITADAYPPVDLGITPARPPAGVGLDRPGVTLVGFAAGLMTTEYDPGSGDDAVPTTSAPYVVAGDGGPNVSITLDPATARVEAIFDMIGLDAPSEGVEEARLDFGSLETADGRSAYIDYDNFGALDAVDEDGDPTSETGGGGLDTHSAAFVAITAAEAGEIADALGYSGSICNCEYTRWGAWSTDGTRTVSEGESETAEYRDRSHLSWWVAGRQPEIGDVPTTGEATYTGHAIASIADGDSRYVAMGSFKNEVNFGNKSGHVTIDNLDGTDYSGTVNFDTSDPRNFGGTANGGTREMTLDGSFFAGPTNPVGEMGGQLTIIDHNDSDYVGGGVFAGSQTTPP